MRKQILQPFHWQIKIPESYVCMCELLSSWQGYTNIWTHARVYLLSCVCVCLFSHRMSTPKYTNHMRACVRIYADIVESP